MSKMTPNPKPTKVSTEVELDKILGIYAMAERDLTYKFHMIGDTQAMRKMTNSAHERATSEATHSITQLIDKEEIKIRLDELTRLYPSITVDGYFTVDGEKIKNRIKKLNAELTPKEQLK